MVSEVRLIWLRTYTSWWKGRTFRTNSQELIQRAKQRGEHVRQRSRTQRKSSGCIGGCWRKTCDSRTATCHPAKHLTGNLFSSNHTREIILFSFQPEEWPKWIQRFERFRKATGLDKQTGKNQVNTLIYTLGEQADEYVHLIQIHHRKGEE